MSQTDYEAVIGLEIHVQLHTKSKLFCGCSTETAFRRDVPPNTHICPICTGHPGVLPRPVNRKAVALATRLAAACHAAIQPVSDFDRKNYFYADLPKGYQITQHGRPLAEGGWVEVVFGGQIRRIRLRHIHLEEDPGKSKVEGGVWLVDMNRCGVPLVEIVTAPDLRSAAEAAAFAGELRRIVRHLGVSEGNMEMGNLRCDANVSIRPAGAETLGTKTEIKNLNSFRFLEDAVTWEIERQTRALAAGTPVKQVTIHWDEYDGEGRLSREKETEADYRYFREPNLIPVVIDERLKAEALAGMPALPSERLRSYMERLGLPEKEAAALVEECAVADYFEAAVAAFPGPAKRVADWVRNHVLRALNDPSGRYAAIADLPATPVYLAELLTLMSSGRISDALGPQIFQRVLETGRPPRTIVEAEGLRPPEEEDLIRMIEQALAEDPETVQRFREGNDKAINRLIGQVMRQAQGRANAQRVRELLIERAARP
jgi:aspartyl-tRNA(Asn)/glutamyl-tRNA(Gln) amidotransferase subunit B